jgi:hypothetical protein
VKLLAHPNGEYYNINNAYHNLKKHALAFTMEQLSNDILLQYISAIPHPDKCYGKMFDIVMYWYEQIKQYTWLMLIGLLSVQTICCMQKAVEDGSL